MLGVSRGTLRSALQRLEESGEIVRRQGSGTFVGRMAVPTAFGERLERLEPYSSVAARRGLQLSAVDVRIEHRAVGARGVRGARPGALEPCTSVWRTLVAGGSPVAVMYDVVHPSIALPELDALRGEVEQGRMVLDVLIDIGVPVTYARTRVMPAVLTARERAGKLLGHHRHHRGPGARGAHLRRARRPGGLLARPVRPRGHRGDGDALAGLAAPGAGGGQGRGGARSAANGRGARGSARASERYGEGGRMPAERGEAPRRAVGSVARATQLLDVLAASETPLGVNELARRIGVNASTASRLLATPAGRRPGDAHRRRALPARAEARDAV